MNSEDASAVDSNSSSSVKNLPAEPKGKEVPDLGPDEWIKVFNFLLSDFNGRAKFGTFMSKRVGWIYLCSLFESQN